MWKTQGTEDELHKPHQKVGGELWTQGTEDELHKPHQKPGGELCRVYHHIVLNNDYPLTLFDLFTFWPNNYITTSRYISSFWNLKNSDACVRVNTCQSINKSLLCLIIEKIFCFNYQSLFKTMWYPWKIVNHKLTIALL
jgi:hypothetical protein